MPEPIICAHVSSDTVDLPDGCGTVETLDFMEIELCYPNGVTSHECEYI